MSRVKSKTAAFLLAASILMAVSSYAQYNSPAAPDASCCVGTVGDCNLSGDDEMTIGDISMIIAMKFINPEICEDHPCLLECDLNQSGGCYPTCDDITIGDLGTMIDFLFMRGYYDPIGNPGGLLQPDCLICD